MTIQDKRLQNGRDAIANYGGVGKLARKMGYSTPRFLVQIFGPNPTRKPSEKTCRKIEEALGLASGALDGDTLAPPASVATPKSVMLDVERLSGMLTQVNDMLEEEGATLSNDKVATLVSLAYEDGNTDRLRAVVRMLM